MKFKLADICDYVKGKTDVSSLDENSYISTENMLPNKGGVIQASNLPSTAQTQAFSAEDTLVSNIRPYFRKIWYAQSDGGCSNDVLVFRHKENIHPRFLYYVLSDDTFFDYATTTSKGTKMPRGDKQAIMSYPVPDISWDEQCKIAGILTKIDEKIEVNVAINKNLEEQAQAIFKAWFVDFEPFGGEMPSDWRYYKLAEFLPVITGKKNANVASDKGIYPFFSCSQDISWTNDYSFEGNAILVAGNGDFNVKFYNGKFEAYQRTYVLIPQNPAYTAWLYYAIQYSLGEITIAARGSVIKFITKGNLENFTIPAPIDIQDMSVINKFGNINEAIALKRKENLYLAQLRDTLLPHLISGEIDVSRIEL